MCTLPAALLHGKNHRHITDARNPFRYIRDEKDALRLVNKKDLKEKVKAAPKELVRRGLDDGTERLRGQLRETAQRGQADDYGGDRIEDTAASGARRAERGAERGIEALLKKKKKGKDRMPQEEPRTASDPPIPQESPADPPSQEPPRIKTREGTA